MYVLSDAKTEVMCIDGKRIVCLIVVSWFVAAIAIPIVRAAGALDNASETLGFDGFDSSKGRPPPPPPPPPQPPQVIPWGISHIKADLVWGRTTGTGINVAFIDSGVQPDHPDLKANIKGGRVFQQRLKNWYDAFGHGTHVAGIIGASSNDIGVVGVAPGVNLWALKIEGASKDTMNAVISAVNWCIATHHDSDPTNDINVISMSIGVVYNPAGWEAAMNNAYNEGIVLVASAGNDGDGDPGTVEWNYPAAYPSVIAVGAINTDDVAAQYSNTGPYVDFMAPGMDIYSTFIGSTYATKEGTSMACPHVSGTVALILTTPVGIYDLNRNGKWDPAEVYDRLRDTARDLGPLDWDPQYGYGLIDAFAATS